MARSIAARRPSLATLGLILVAVSGCAPVRVSERNEDVETGRRTVVGPGRGLQVVARARTEENWATLTLQAHQTCEQHEERLLHRTRLTQRKASVGAQVLFYLAAIGGLAAGAGVLGDVPNIPAANDPVTQNPVGKNGAYAIGAIQLVAGATFMGLGLATTIRGRDSEEDVGTVRDVIASSQKSVECGKRPLAEQPISLVGERGTRVEIGKTDPSGQIVVRWERIGALFETDAPRVATVLAGQSPVASFDLSAARAFWARDQLRLASELAKIDDVDEATAHADRAEALGGDATVARVAIATAPTTIRRREEAEKKERAENEQRARLTGQHTLALQQRLKRGDVEGARAELERVRELGANVSSLQSEIDRVIDDQVTRKARNLFAKCQKVSRGRAQMERVSRCDQSCEAIRKRIDADWERLMREKIDVAGLSDERKQVIREQCSEAGCPECP